MKLIELTTERRTKKIQFIRNLQSSRFKPILYTIGFIYSQGMIGEGGSSPPLQRERERERERREREIVTQRKER